VIADIGAMPIRHYMARMANGFPGRPPTAGETRERMQRVRVGMTGLAAVGLIVMIATAVASGVRRSATENAASAGPPAVVATMPVPAAGDKSEPLATLGVAPDAKDVSAPPAPKPAN
jgi:hypothetical protein